jgi:hypothetical protein
MADLYSQVIRGDGVSTATVGGNTKRIFPTSEMGTPKITPVLINTEGQTLPSGEVRWAQQSGADNNFLLTGNYQTQGDVFLVVQAIQQFCTVYEVGASTISEHLTVMCRDSSIPYDAGTTFQNDGSTITVLQTAVRAALGGALVTVNIGRIEDDDTDG